MVRNCGRILCPETAVELMWEPYTRICFLRWQTVGNEFLPAVLFHAPDRASNQICKNPERVPAAASNATTIQGASFHTVSNRKPASARAKSCPVRTALVHTGS
jgi:hypothetical protein